MIKFVKSLVLYNAQEIEIDGTHKRTQWQLSVGERE